MSTQDVVDTRSFGGRLGPVVAGAAVVITLLVLAWVSGPPAALAGPVADAPFTLDARLVTQPDDDGCVDVVDGRGTVVTHCVDLDDDGDRAHIARFTTDGDIAIGTWDHMLVIDPDTGAVLGTTTEAELEEQRHADGAEPVEPGSAGRLDGPRGPELDESWVATEGSRVVRHDREPDVEPEVLLDLDGPPGYWLRQAELSPDGDLLILVDRERVMVAEVGADEAFVWHEADDGWIELWYAIHWG